MQVGPPCARGCPGGGPGRCRGLQAPGPRGGGGGVRGWAWGCLAGEVEGGQQLASDPPWGPQASHLAGVRGKEGLLLLCRGHNRAQPQPGRHSGAPATRDRRRSGRGGGGACVGGLDLGTSVVHACACGRLLGGLLYRPAPDRGSCCCSGHVSHAWCVWSPRRYCRRCCRALKGGPCSYCRCYCRRYCCSHRRTLSPIKPGEQLLQLATAERRPRHVDGREHGRA